ncbi:hypothetical protein SAMN05660964_00443 [Thiothrix caldifontis]|uniref:Uncharacterized protein n=1 Tax=Thiothrix caldifontis TaxID=525918 RepID=A0A1H3WGU0_9GAMM|nr:hypothetical protein [Thiothrix caldifontis]SDZ86359.1 hypothetical protein SAMN05660964_00443 [Thiothrix caldifontis]
MHTSPQLTVIVSILLATSLITGCTETLPSKATEPQSVQDIAKEAMNSKGKLSKEQIDALIRANAACRPDDK